MESVNLEGLICIRASSSFTCDNIVRSIVSRVDQVTCVTPSPVLSRKKYPESWSYHPIKEGEPLPTSLKDSSLLVDFLDLMCIEQGTDTILRDLYKLKGEARVVVVPVYPFSSLMSYWERLSSLADAVFDVIEEGPTRLISHGTLFKKSGKIVELKEEIKINKDTSKLTSKRCTDVRELPAVSQEPADVPDLSTSFNMGLNLKESERAAKEKLQLPYTKMQEEENLVEFRMTGNKKIRVGGQVIYTPDEADDLDDEDPDDDLHL